MYEKIAESGSLNGFPFEGMFVDAGTPSSFIEASQACISSQRYSSGTELENSWFGEDSQCIGEIAGSSLGPTATVAEGCIIRNSVILEGASIGENCHLKDCLIGKGAIISPGTVLSGEIVNHTLSE